MIKETTNTGKELERWVADAYRQMGARKVEHDVEMAGNQIDVYVELETPGCLLHRVAVEVKDWSRSVGIDVVNKFATVAGLLRAKDEVDEGVIVSREGFSKQARNAARTHNILLLEPADLEEWLRREREPDETLSPPRGLLAHLVVPLTIAVPAGPFWMGSPPEYPEAHGNEKPGREFYLRGYRIGRYPVTNAQYASFVHCTENRAPEYWKEGKVPVGLEDHPVVNVSHENAEEYCRWLSQVTGNHYRLPTEEEWEKAARGALPEARRYPWGNEWRLGFCNVHEMGQNGTTSVYEFERTNQSPFEAVDMAGNVCEWTASWYERYPGSPHESLHYGRLFRVVRGGSWSHSRWDARISWRGRHKPDVRRPYVGFRVMLEAFD